MIRSICILIALSVSLFTAAPRGLVAAESTAAQLDIRDPDGQVIIAADQVQFYDWASHTLALQPAVRAKLATSLLEGKRLVSGVPFSLCVGGKPIYDGMFTTSVSSKSFFSPVIVMAGGLAAGENQLHIQLGYPTEKYFEGQDPRADKRIEDALRAAGKLVDTRQDRISWVARSLLEMQTIKQGSTREELLEVFVEEGGLSGRAQRRYAYRDCPYFKVDVKFDPASFSGSNADNGEEQPQDKVSQISTPFLEFMISD